jgi:peptidyl-dipeptidase Dcp
VLSFSHNLLAKAKPAAQKRVCRFTGFRQRTDGSKPRKWDGGYYSEKLKQNYLILTTN